MNTLVKAGASKDGPPPSQRDVNQEKTSVLEALTSLLPADLVIVSPSSPNSPPTPRHPLLSQTLEFVASLVVDLVYARQFADPEVWKRCVGTYMRPWVSGGAEIEYAESARKHFLAADQASSSVVIQHCPCLS